MKDDDVGCGVAVVVLGLVVLCIVGLPKSCASQIPRDHTSDEIRQIIREEMERAKTGRAPAEEGK